MSDKGRIEPPDCGPKLDLARHSRVASSGAMPMTAIAMTDTGISQPVSA
jgi:hypothetical protein